MSDDVIRVEVPRELEVRYRQVSALYPAGGFDPSPEYSRRCAAYYQAKVTLLDEAGSRVSGEHSQLISHALIRAENAAADSAELWAASAQRQQDRIELGTRVAQAFAEAGVR